MINLNNISFAYDKKPIFENFSLNINTGDRICFFGESGCGKTTLLRLILGLEQSQKGEIFTDHKFSVVFQENRLLPFLTVLENITLLGADTKTALYHLQALGISNVAYKKPQELSGGMKRRAAIGRALSVDFDAIILDEPFAGLDENNIALCAEHILKHTENKTVILVSHSKQEAELLKTKIIYL
ncbi:MAG: ABC transporter ATP-binding protein [Clostridia bacterium]|nr:ABC transporter ATP-binding protein [Clostridia bacterium]